jgi:hypothetical protein
MPERAVSSGVVFTVNSTNSVISLAGSIDYYGFVLPFDTQGEGSLTASYAGTLVVDLQATAIQFPGGSDVYALTNGTWQPATGGTAGSAPADYGGEISESLGFLGSTTGYAAGRNLKFDVTSPWLTLSNSQIDASTVEATFLTNTVPVPSVDFYVTGTGLFNSTNGTTSLVGSSTNGQAFAIFTNTMGLITIIIPLDFTNTVESFGDDLTMILTGKITASAPESAWPLLVGVGLQGPDVILNWPSIAGQTFSVETSSDLYHWTTASGKTATAGNVTTWSATPIGHGQFYRVLMQ